MELALGVLTLLGSTALLWTGIRGLSDQEWWTRFLKTWNKDRSTPAREGSYFSLDPFYQYAFPVVFSFFGILCFIVAIVQFITVAKTGVFTVGDPNSEDSGSSGGAFMFTLVGIVISVLGLRGLLDRKWWITCRVGFIAGRSATNEELAARRGRLDIGVALFITCSGLITVVSSAVETLHSWAG